MIIQTLRGKFNRLERRVGDQSSSDSGRIQAVHDSWVPGRRVLEASTLVCRAKALGKLEGMKALRGSMDSQVY